MDIVGTNGVDKRWTCAELQQTRDSELLTLVLACSVCTEDEERQLDRLKRCCIALALGRNEAGELIPLAPLSAGSESCT